MLRQQRLTSKVSLRAAGLRLMMSTDAVPDNSSRLNTPTSLTITPSGYALPLLEVGRQLIKPLVNWALIVLGTPVTASRLLPAVTTRPLRLRPISFTADRLIEQASQMIARLKGQYIC